MADGEESSAGSYAEWELRGSRRLTGKPGSLKMGDGPFEGPQIPMGGLFAWTSPSSDLMKNTRKGRE